MKVEITAVASVSGRWRTKAADQCESQHAEWLLSQLPQLAPHAPLIDVMGSSYPVEIDILHNWSDLNAPARKLKFPELSSLMNDSFICLRTTVDHDDDFVDKWMSEGFGELSISRADGELMIADSVRDALQNQFHEISLALHVACLGAVSITETYAFHELNRNLHVGPGNAHMQQFHTEAQMRGWPDIKALDLLPVWRWLIAIPGYRSHVSSTRLGRALSALSHILSRQDRLENRKLDIAWALLGLETLYCRGNSNLQGQISEKSAVYLGPPKQHKKAFSNMYNFRSRLLHGDIDVPYAFNKWDGTDEVERFNDEDYTSVALGVAMLCATLQRMFEEQRYDLEFKYVPCPQEFA